MLIQRPGQQMLFAAPGMMAYSRRSQAPAGWWMAAGVAPVVAYQALGAASLAASLTDLSGNGNDAVDPGGAATPGWTGAGGWEFDGIQTYLATPYYPIAGSGRSMAVQFSDGVAATACLCGAWDTATSQGLYFLPSLSGKCYYTNGGQNSIAPGISTGNLIVAGLAGYRNGVLDVTLAPGTIVAIAQPVLLGRYNRPSQPRYWPGKIRAFAIWNSALDASQAEAVADAMAAL